MPRKYYPKSSKKTARKAPRRKYARRVYKKPSFAVRVKRVMHRLAENKIQSIPFANNSLINAGSSVNPYYISLMPTPVQGTSVQERIGNNIEVVKSTIRGFVNLLPYNASTNDLSSPIKVKMWLCSRKRTNRAITSAPIATDWQNFFQSGSTSLGFQSSILDMLLYNNKDWWNIYSTRTFELSPNLLGQTFTTTTFTQSPTGRMSMPFSFDLTKYLGKLKYNDTGTYPTNKELYLVFQTVRADGTVQTTPTPVYAEVHAVVEHQFEDA